MELHLVVDVGADVGAEESRGLIAAEWGLSENNRRAKFYRLTAAGRRALQAESATWQRYVDIVARVLAAAQQPA